MRKQIILALAIFMGVFSFAQKKELKDAEKAIKDNNFAEAKTYLQQVESMLSTMDDKNKSKYYYLNSVTLYANGNGSMADIEASVESMGKVKDGYEDELSELKTNMINAFLKKGNAAYETKKYADASNQFESVYKISKNDTIYLYYAAVAAVSEPNYDRALDLYLQLRDIGYTGVGTQYYATNVETGEEEIMDKNTRDLYVKAKSHSNPGKRLTESKRPEIVKNIALIYVNNGDNEKAIDAMQEARAQSPDDVNLILTEANVHYKMGNNDKFKELLEQATKMDPNNAELQYNLGVIASESGDVEAAKKYYRKTLEIDPTFVNAYINMGALVLNGETAIIDEMNKLGTSAADDKRYEELKNKRFELYREAIPYLDKALEIKPKNIDAARTLMNIYSSLGETDKFKAMKAKVEELEGN